MQTILGAGGAIGAPLAVQEMVLKNMLQGKKGQWFARLDKKHSFTYISSTAVSSNGNSISGSRLMRKG